MMIEINDVKKVAAVAVGSAARLEKDGQDVSDNYFLENVRKFGMDF